MGYPSYVCIHNVYNSTINAYTLLSDNGIVVVLKLNLVSPLTSVLVKYVNHCRKS